MEEEASTTISTTQDEQTDVTDELKLSNVSLTNETYLAGTFTTDIQQLLQTSDTDRLKQLYDILAEVDDVDIGKTTCSKLYCACFEDMMNIVKMKGNKTMKYLVWHFLQLMTCCKEAKLSLFDDKDAIPHLLELDKFDWNEEETLSLKNISLNYILVMMADTNDEYFDYIASTDVIPYFYRMLQDCTLKPEDPLIELLLLGLNLLLEGSNNCKKQLNELDFKSLLSKKIGLRERCPANMLMVANQTYQKFTLLGSEHKSFVETFRKDFSDEVKKNSLYNDDVCSNSQCPASGRSVRIATSLQRCARCKRAWYCSKECQVTHWKTSHSKMCIPAK